MARRSTIPIRAVLSIFSERRLQALAMEDDTYFGYPPTLKRVQRSLSRSLELVVLAVIVGGLTGGVLDWFFGPATGIGNQLLQWVGIGFLLWAALGVSGWEIQTPTGKTFVEKVNRWACQGLLLIGTFLLAASVGWRTAAVLGGGN